METGRSADYGERMIGPEVAAEAPVGGPAPCHVRPGRARFDGVWAQGVVDHVDLAPDASWSPDGGFWAVVVDFEGRVRAWRFAEVHHGDDGGAGEASAGWAGPDADAWCSSLDREEYLAGVGRVRHAVREGEVYQVNLCRVLTAPLPADPHEPDPWALSAVLRQGNPAPYAATVHVPSAGRGAPGTGAPSDQGVWVVSASPELFLEVGDGHVVSGPIKGTATPTGDLGAKDQAENIMITDLVRNDLQRVCEPGTVEVLDLLAREQHPGLVHLVSRVRGALLEPRPAWDEIRAATFPPASVSGAPKAAALDLIRELEPVERGPYCGAVGWWDADTGRAVLAVGIRTFWWTPEAGGTLRFGTGAGITWGSDPAQEWAETELKASRLVALASSGPRRVVGPTPPGRGEDEDQEPVEGTR